MSKRILKSQLLDMKDCCEKIISYSQNLLHHEIINNPEKMEAILFNFIILGEVANKLPHEFADSNPSIEWRKIAGLRHRMVHDYADINHLIVLEISASEIPKLLTFLKTVINNEINVDSIAPVKWKNGGGVTRDLRVTDAFKISLADIDQDGAFSSFENTTRHFAVVEGEGVFLEFGYDSHRLTPHSAPFTFAGDNPPYCRLLNGKTRDINLMVFKGKGEMNLRYNPRFQETGFLALETAGDFQRFDFIWYGEEKPLAVDVKGIWFGITA